MYFILFYFLYTWVVATTIAWVRVAAACQRLPLHSVAVNAVFDTFVWPCKDVHFGFLVCVCVCGFECVGVDGYRMHDVCSGLLSARRLGEGCTMHSMHWSARARARERERL